MEIVKVRFEAFKSLYDMSCALDHMTVITGPNGSGKSNLVDALNFLGEVYSHGLEIAVSRSGGYENIAHRRTRRAKRPISVTVEATLSAREIKDAAERGFEAEEFTDDLYDTALRYRHTFAFKTAGQALRSDFMVSDETLEILAGDGKQLFRQSRIDNRIDTWVSPGKASDKRLVRAIVGPFGDKRFRDYLEDRAIPSTALMIEQNQYANVLWSIRRAIAGLRIFQLSPHECRASGVPTPNAFLERHGDNLPAAADHLKRNDSRAWRKIQSAMRSILPDLISIDVAYTEDRRLALQFRERGIGRPWSSGEVSDGTIQALAMFIALFDSRSTMIVIEEPETSVHPWILRQFLDLCREQSAKQLLLTTHSPVLLNYVPASLVRLMYMRDGRSQISRIDELSSDVARLALTGELSLFDAYDSGVLPEAVPRGYLESREEA